MSTRSKTPLKSLKRIGRGPFRGPTPEDVIQTLDVGAGTTPLTLDKAKMYKHRKYLVADPIYSHSKINSSLDLYTRSKYVELNNTIHGEKVDDGQGGISLRKA